MHEQADFSLTTPERICFTEALPENHWTNNPSPLPLQSE